jgi:outer membrane receptor protein involved in Fe transport
VTYCPLVNDTVFSGGNLPFTGKQWVGPWAPAGTNLPVTPKFKGNLVARYQFDEVGGGWKPWTQLSWVYQTQTSPSLVLWQEQNIGMIPASAIVDLVVGAHDDRSTLRLVVTNLADRHIELSRFTQTNPVVDNQAYIIPGQPRTVYLKFGQKF